MLNPQLYQPVYLIGLSVLTVLQVHYYYENRGGGVVKRHGVATRFIIPLALTCVLAFFIGMRPYYAGFTDMFNYNEMFNHTKQTLQVNNWDWNTTNVIFDNFFRWSALTFENTTPFYLIVAVAYFGGIGIACCRFFPGHTTAGLLTYLAAFSTFSYGVNGIKAGAAAAVFLIALTCYNKKWLMLLLAVVSLGIHHSMQLCLATLVMAMLIRAPKFYFALWLACFIVALFHITAFQDLFASMSDESGASYLGQVVEDENKGLGGFRIDFILYSFAPIAMWLYVVLVKKMDSEYYDFLISLYLLTNAVWLLCIYANFTNRIAYLSWFMLPIVLIYPVLHPAWGESRFKDFSFIMLAHLSFTLFMNFVYYA